MTQKFHENETATIALYKYHELLECEAICDRLKGLLEVGSIQEPSKISLDLLAREYLRSFMQGPRFPQFYSEWIDLKTIDGSKFIQTDNGRIIWE